MAYLKNDNRESMPPKIDRYQVVSCDSLSHLESAVNSLIGTGWQPIGGITLDRAPTGHYDQRVTYYQTMGLVR